MNIERKVFSFFCWLVICVGASQRSMAEPLPIPEYFGTYAVVDGKLLKLDGQELNAERTAIVRMGQRNGIGNVVKHEPAAMPPKSVRIIELPADLKIVVFAQSGGLQSPLDIAKSLHLEPLVFVRTLTIDAGWPTSIKRSDPENGWDTGDAVELLVLAGGGERELEFLFKPMPGQKDMVVAGLAEKLKPGVYHLTLGGGGFFFAVQPVAEGESGKCVDALMTYAMMTADTKYTPCAGAPSTVTRAPTADSVEKSAAKTALSEGRIVSAIAWADCSSVRRSLAYMTS